jgi:uncharacterized protein (DUF2267 family)
MRLRTRLQDELTQRLNATLPEAIATVWDHRAVLVAIEQMKFTPAGGIENDWERETEFDGVVRAELRADGIDALEVEPLIADLVKNPVHLNFDPDQSEGELSERARILLAEWRDSIRDQTVVSALRFSVSGTLAQRLSSAQRPELLISHVPDGDQSPKNRTSVLELIT